MADPPPRTAQAAGADSAQRFSPHPNSRCSVQQLTMKPFIAPSPKHAPHSLIAKDAGARAAAQARTGIRGWIERACQLALGACVLTLGLIPAAQAEFGDEQVIAAREAFRANDRARLERLARETREHPLADYVEYWRMAQGMRTLKEVDPATAQAFLARNERSHVANLLRADWLKLAGAQRQWELFDSEYAKLPQPDQELGCYSLQARLARGELGASRDALPLWLRLLEPPAACAPVLDALVSEQKVSIDDMWTRIRLQFEANKMQAARASIRYLPATQQPEPEVVNGVIDRPLVFLVRLPSELAADRAARELAALAIQRMARNDPAQAATQLERIETALQPGERGWAWSMLGWEAARRHLPEALDWFGRAGDAPLSETVIQWKARAALRAQDWEALRATIEKMPPALAALPDWTYWLGRAYRAGGRSDEARALFKRIAGQPNFYGNLADDELNRPIAPPPKAREPSAEELDQVAARSSIQRALALFRLNLRAEAIAEWNFALRGMNDRELLAAAEIARRANLYDRAIATAERTRNEHDYTLRYLSPFDDSVRPVARQQSLDEAWVYGLMRQESRFITNARSGVGAAGLMQLMPATARWVAKKIGLKDFRPKHVVDTDTNVLLGTSYMRMVLDGLDQDPVLASAAYNAGPSRARKWRAETPLEGAIYAETIPFTETRDYVKKVMSNAVYYSALFEGKPQSLKSRLGVVGPRGTNDAGASALP